MSEDLCDCAECRQLDRRFPREGHQLILPLTPPRKDRTNMLYLITTFPDREGVTLSKPGHWGGKPFPDPEAARLAALEDARTTPEIRTETVRRKRVQSS